jgi:hypothetical protein
MSTQWHPLFARLLRLLLEEFYQLDTEVPVRTCGNGSGSGCSPFAPISGRKFETWSTPLR